MRVKEVLSKAAVFVLASTIPVVAWAVCTCGFGDGQLTLTSINTDGNMSDWASVHADLDNNVCDGPSGGIPDLDAPVQSTGRDLTHFAYTYDATNVYLFTERSGSVSNTQSFVYYADTDNDGLMETGEPVIGVTWRGSNRLVNVYLFTYVAQTAGGDSMVDGNGLADGYTLPGSFAGVPSTGNPTRFGNWGAANGQQMEFFVTWAELGIAPGSPFTFHVSSSNAALGAGSFTQQIDDNLSGCGGGLGSTVQPGVTFTPDLALTGFVGQTVVGVHTLTNDSNADDSFDFAAVISGDYTPTVSYYEDTDASGTLTAGDTLLTDTDGDTFVNTGVLAPAESVGILIVYGIPGTATSGDTATVVSTASSDFQPLANDSVTDTIDALLGPDLVVTKQAAVIWDPVNLFIDPLAIPGSIIEYTISVENQGGGTVDTDTLQIVDPIPAEQCLLVSDIGGAGSGPVDFADGSPSSGLSYTFLLLGSALDDVSFSDDDGLSFNYTPLPDSVGCDAAVTTIEIRPLGEFAADTGAGSPTATFSFRAIVN